MTKTTLARQITGGVDTHADELMKLAQLRDAGVLSPEELEVQKARATQPPA